ncbi:hypothetical protein L2E82_27365 [Cichorium intybus]|uniref:Uncharacterized protein n=1 Tax=Cichorium intybus TaxID=13427 RepID=A0ACB9CT05_CICIN|nr:hypothetical protein L2E82_27365 [Cichorium intybus]
MANLLGQHSAERNQYATAYVGNLDPQLLSCLFIDHNPFSAGKYGAISPEISRKIKEWKSQAIMNWVSNETSIEVKRFNNNLKSHSPGAVRTVAWLHSEQTILSTRDVRSGKIVHSLATKASITNAEVSKDDRYITTADGSSAKFWDANHFGLVKCYEMSCNVESASLEPKFGDKFIVRREDILIIIFFSGVIQIKLVNALTPSTLVNGNIGPQVVHCLALKELDSYIYVPGIKSVDDGSNAYGFAFGDFATLHFWVGSISDDASCAALVALLMQNARKNPRLRERIRTLSHYVIRRPSRDIGKLLIAGKSLEEARKGIERSHGKESTRLRILHGNSYPEIAL